jgi:aconitate hydratase
MGFNVVGYGCTTCIGNSGPIAGSDLRRPSTKQPDRRRGALGQPQLRGPDHPDVKANYLASPPLVVAYALAGTMDIDFESEKIQGKVSLKDIWPTQKEVNDALAKAVTSDLFQKRIRQRIQSQRDVEQHQGRRRATHTRGIKNRPTLRSRTILRTSR